MSMKEISENNFFEAGDVKSLSWKGNGNGRKDLIFVSFASLAVHIGLVLILSTATAMSIALRIGEVSVLHVSLVAHENDEGAHGERLLKSTLPASASLVKNASEVVDRDKERAVDTLEEKTLSKAVMESDSIKVSSLHNTAFGDRKEIGVDPAQQGSGDQLAHAREGNSGVKTASIAVPKYRENTYPSYPWIARLRGYEGIVVISAEVNPDGSVGHLRVKKSSGYAVLDRSALDAVKTWRFEPGRKMGNPVSMWVDVPVKFVLKRSEPM